VAIDHMPVIIVTCDTNAKPPPMSQNFITLLSQLVGMWTTIQLSSLSQVSTLLKYTIPSEIGQAET